MKATLPVVYDAGDFVLSSFRDRVGASAPILETEARIERIVAGLRSCEQVRWVSAASAYEQALEVAGRVHSSEYLRFLATTSERAEAEVIDARFAEAGVLPDTPVTRGPTPPPSERSPQPLPRRTNSSGANARPTPFAVLQGIMPDGPSWAAIVS